MGTETFLCLNLICFYVVYIAPHSRKLRENGNHWRMMISSIQTLSEKWLNFDDIIAFFRGLVQSLENGNFWCRYHFFLIQLSVQVNSMFFFFWWQGGLPAPKKKKKKKKKK